MMRSIAAFVGLIAAATVVVYLLAGFACANQEGWSDVKCDMTGAPVWVKTATS